MTNPKCISCGNENPEELGKELQDNFADYDYYCKGCGNVFTSHYDLTSFKTITDTDKLLEKYPQLKDQIKNDNAERRGLSNNQNVTATTATNEGGTEEEKAQNVALSSDETANQNNTITQSPSAKTNKKNIDKQA